MKECPGTQTAPDTRREHPCTQRYPRNLRIEELLYISEFWQIWIEAVLHCCNERVPRNPESPQAPRRSANVPTRSAHAHRDSPGTQTEPRHPEEAPRHPKGALMHAEIAQEPTERPGTKRAPGHPQCTWAPWDHPGTQRERLGTQRAAKNTQNIRNTMKKLIN